MSDDIFHKFTGLAEGQIPPDEEAMMLVEAAKAAGEPNPFKPTDLIKPRPFAPLISMGVHVVLESLVDGFQDVPGYPQHRFNLRVATLCPNKHVHPYWAEHWMFDPYAHIPIIGRKREES